MTLAGAISARLDEYQGLKLYYPDEYYPISYLVKHPFVLISKTPVPLDDARYHASLLFKSVDFLIKVENGWIGAIGSTTIKLQEKVCEPIEMETCRYEIYSENDAELFVTVGSSVEIQVSHSSATSRASMEKELDWISKGIDLDIEKSFDEIQEFLENIDQGDFCHQVYKFCMGINESSLKNIMTAIVNTLERGFSPMISRTNSTEMGKIIREFIIGNDIDLEELIHDPRKFLEEVGLDSIKKELTASLGNIQLFDTV